MKTAVLIAAMLLVAQLATAQMMSGSHGGSTGGGMMGNGSTTTNAGMNGGMGNGMGGYGYGPMGGAMGQALTVDSTGVAYVVRTNAQNGTTTPAVQVLAIRPSGTIAWTANVDGGMTRVKLSGNLLLIANGGDAMGMQYGTAPNDDDKSQLVALSTASGSVQWTLDLDGFASSLEPFSGGTYVNVIKGDFTNMNGTNGVTGPQAAAMTRTLLAIGPDGKVLWTVPLS